MALSTFITTLRSLLIILCLVNFGLDLFFVKTYTENQTLVLLWRFFVQFGLTGIFGLYFIINLIVFVVKCRRLQHEPAPSYASYGKPHGAVTWALVGSLIRALFVIGLSVSMLCVTLLALVQQLRSVIILPLPRNSAQYQALDSDFSAYNPKDLFHCPSSSIGQPLTLVCSFDRSTTILGAIIAGFAVLEAMAMLMYENRSQSSWGKRHGEFDLSQHVAMEAYPGQGQRTSQGYGYQGGMQPYSAGHLSRQLEQGAVMPTERVPLTEGAGH